MEARISTKNRIIKDKIARELHAPARRLYPRRHVELYGIGDLYQGDLVDMTQLSGRNLRKKFILTVIDAFSKYAYAEPLRNKSGVEVAAALEKIFKKASPRNFQTDAGTEFYNKTCEAVYAKYRINHYSSYTIMKASIVERFNRTLKERMYREFTASNSYRWVDKLQDLVRAYNETKHRTTGIAPNLVSKANELEILDRIAMRQQTPVSLNPPSPKFAVNEIVRIGVKKRQFEKGYTKNWSTELFSIERVDTSSKPIVYYVKDSEGRSIKGAFYDVELRKTSFPDIHLVEKIVKRDKTNNRVFVKWLGIPSTDNSWIPESDII